MVLGAIRTFYALRKSKKFLYSMERLYRRKENTLGLEEKEFVRTHIAFLHEAIKARNVRQVSENVHRLESAAGRFMARSRFEKFYDVVTAVGIALLIAVVVRQMWFELYTIPTGSMRPTLKENDFLVVSKDDFGLNIPLKTAHFTFDPSLVQRGNIVVWTTENMDIPDSDMNYFYLFPGKKQFVKRLVGKPGDTLYFYGGKIYGIDRSGNEIHELHSAPWAKNLEHIPFMQLEGRVELESSGGGRGISATFFQMNQPVAKIMAHPLGWLEGEVFGQDGKTLSMNYSDLWGMKNYAKARLLTLEQLKEIYPKLASTLDEGVLYLELSHHPSVRDAKIVQEGSRHRPGMGVSVSILPLQQKHLERLGMHMTTCRFTVKNGLAHRIGQEQYPEYFPELLGVPDGTYEMQDGVASQVYFGGITHKLSKDHPLYKTDPLFIQKLYNLGIEFLNIYEPSKSAFLTPSRYAYFRDGALCLLNAQIIFANEAPLQNFVKRELERKKVSTSKRPYLPFVDAGAPFTADGKLDVELISRYGLKIPEKKYLMLGDNHPMSADSRVYGLVSEDNLKGTARFLFSPPGDRWGSLPQPSAEYWTLPTFIVWGSALSSAVGYYLYRRRRIRMLIGKI